MTSGTIVGCWASGASFGGSLRGRYSSSSLSKNIGVRVVLFIIDLRLGDLAGILGMVRSLGW